MTKEQLAQYFDLQAENDENEERIKKLEREITDLDAKINKIIEEGTVIDKVTGGDGGKQGYKIEGFPYPEMDANLAKLRRKRNSLNLLEDELKVRQEYVAPTLNEIHEFIKSVSDPHIKRIIRYRYEEKETWDRVAVLIGGGNTADSVRKAMTRFLKNEK